MSIRRADASSAAFVNSVNTQAPAAPSEDGSDPSVDASNGAAPAPDSSFDGAGSDAAKVSARTARNLARVDPVGLRSADGQKAIVATTNYLHAKLNKSGLTKLTPSGPGLDYTPHAVMKDALGLTHVRMDQTFNGLPIFGAQVVSHLDASGNVADVTDNTQATPPADLDTTAKLSPNAALDAAKQDFGDDVENKPKPALGIYQSADGEFHTAYSLSLTNVSNGAYPKNMQYYVDAQSGAVLAKYNTIDGLTGPSAPSAAPAASATSSTSSSTRKPISFKAGTSISSTLHLSKDLSTGAAKLTLDLSHKKPGSVKVTLTTPSGKQVDVPFTDAASVNTTVDLSSALAGESSKGAWKLTLTDSSSGDTGSLVKWGLKLSAGSTPPPPPPPVTGTADDTTLYAGKVDISATKNADGTYKLADATRGKGVSTVNLNNGTSTSSDFADNNNVWGESSDPASEKGAVDAQYAGQMTYDFYKNEFGRDSIDGKGFALKNRVHYDRAYDNAFWDGTQMNYGDGDGTEFGPLTSIDIGGHEISHGFTQDTANLVYQGESGGLNEAMSDIMGTGVKWFASQQNPAVKFSWGIGTDAYTPGTAGDALRYMDDPTKDGYSIDNYKNIGVYSAGSDNGGVHGSSGIANNAFYLMAEGGTNRTSGLKVASGMGMDDALKIMYRAETVYYTPNETFAQAAQACVKAATDLFGASSAQVKTTTDAWKAVGCIS